MLTEPKAAGLKPLIQATVPITALVGSMSGCITG
jgi:hypothetical protein